MPSKPASKTLQHRGFRHGPPHNLAHGISIFDFVQGITRLARDKTQQDARLDMEGRAKKLLDRVG